MDYARRLRPKGIPFSAWRCKNGWGLHELKQRKVKEKSHVPMFVFGGNVSFCNLIGQFRATFLIFVLHTRDLTRSVLRRQTSGYDISNI